ncbi:MAG: sodium-dependent transporter [Elusimicrobia bacterium]|nr:MAG: sodium-dependent transporter [Elusimicrobiota bacterium]
MSETADRGHWGSRLGFLLACAGSAVGLGNIWKFPYIAGENGGGAFVLIYLVCIFFVGIPIMICEFAIGRSTHSSPVKAFGELSGGSKGWIGAGILSVAAAFVLLSFYSVVAGWAMHYVYLSVTGFGGATGAEAIGGIFGEVFSSTKGNLFWHFAFIAMTTGIVLGGVQAGIERASRILMPTLFIMLFILLAKAVTMPGFGKAVTFVFYPDLSKLSSAGILEALGHSFFTLSLGMGSMMTYGSYLKDDFDIVRSSFVISVLDTAVALLACLIMYPIIFSFGMDPQAGPGLVFKSMPIVFAQMPFGMPLATLFFVLLTFAALSSAISLLEPVTAYMIDNRGWSRVKATLIPAAAIFLFGVPSALSGDILSGYHLVGEKTFFDTMDFLVSNIMMPLAGLFIAVFVGYRMDIEIVKKEFASGKPLNKLFSVWFFMVKYVCPVAVTAVFIHVITK